jgi:hypothetical protein
VNCTRVRRDRLGWGVALAAAVAVLVPARSVSAQQVRELGVEAIATASDPALVVAGGYAALRTTLRTRVSLAAAAGETDGSAAGRGELLVHFLLNPTRLSGAGAYVAGGVAGIVGPTDQGYVVVTLGLEGAPGRRSGWFLEAGVGGGARLAGGWRWRRFPAGWPDR